MITLTDLELRIIPNVGGRRSARSSGSRSSPSPTPDELPENLIAAAIGGASPVPVALAYPRGMGMGDAKLVAMMGLFLGRAVAPAVLIGFAAGALVGVAMIARHGAEARKRAIPFGPFLALGGVVGSGSATRSSTGTWTSSSRGHRRRCQRLKESACKRRS